ncbi:glutathione S-transferase [Oceanomicrobium pacificus]|uniref:Glutathione S-transferase n=1 Tax=Oceanomicrobium pacificus TaxID=2692916 RepID=A0A6B0U005_9RHOB|nr:glutathione S-transferase [Oceanomicrobium pacificus]MXU64471.1 glutathione S-transferase [Oceanomicrobium pacificus]
MTYHLAIGDRTNSSWSLRGWLLFAGFGLPVEIDRARMKSQAFRDMLDAYKPAQLVPAMRIDAGGQSSVVWDSLAMAETLAERHPERGFWPADPALRAMARSMVAEMHAGFTDLRTDCTMNLRHTYPDFRPSAAVMADVERIDRLWTGAFAARDAAGMEGNWLFGAYSLADVFYAPVASRITTYALPVSEPAAAYVTRVIESGPFREWREAGLAEKYVQPGYDLDLEPQPWPEPCPAI